MSINASSEYGDGAALAKAVKARIASQAKTSGVPQDTLRRDFIFQRFLARLFEESGSPWVLKGGTGLRLRVPGARSSMDVDLLHREAPAGPPAVDALRSALTRRSEDQIWFSVKGTGKTSQINPVTAVTVEANIGTKVYLTFAIDLAHDLHFVAPVETIRPTPAITVPGLPDPPPITCYPLVDQVADKVCAMYEVTASGPSSRYRDLIDLVLILRYAPLEAPMLRQALDAEMSRRHMTVGIPLGIPGPGWRRDYPRQAREWLPAPFTEPEQALALVGRCIEPLLDGTVTTGTWHPGIGWGPATGAGHVTAI